MIPFPHTKTFKHIVLILLFPNDPLSLFSTKLDTCFHHPNPKILMFFLPIVTFLILTLILINILLLLHPIVLTILRLLTILLFLVLVTILVFYTLPLINKILILAFQTNFVEEFHRLYRTNLENKFKVTAKFHNLCAHPDPSTTTVLFKSLPQYFIATNSNHFVSDNPPFRLLHGSITLPNTLTFLKYTAQI